MILQQIIVIGIYLYHKEVCHLASLETNINQLNSDIQAIKSAIKDTGVSVEDTIKTSEYAEKISQVYEAGKEDSYDEINYLNEELEKTLYGTDSGGKSYYDMFWDLYQDYGNKTNYDNAFGGQGWRPDNFKPKYNIRPTNGYMMFRAFGFADDHEYKDMAQHLESLGIVLDFSNCTSMQYGFQLASAKRIGKIDLSKCTSTNSLFAYSTIYKIDEIVFSEITHIDGGMFADCGLLETVKFSGVITKSGLNMGDCKSLNNESIRSIFETLSTDTSDLTVTLSQKAVDTAFETSVGANDGHESAEWNALAKTRDNWTISLV